MRIKNLIFALPLVLTGCATPYQKMGFRGGVEFTQLNNSVFEIQASGNAYTRSRTIKDYVLLRAAELCLDKGFVSFVPVGNEVDTKTKTINSQSHSFPGRSMTVKMYAKGESEPSTAYSCSIVYDNLAPKYKKDG